MNNNILQPVSKSSLQKAIVDQLQQRILSGDLPAGVKLPAERQLALDFQVNRGTLREAMKKLELLGLVEIHHGDGIYIKDYLESGNLELLNCLLNQDGMANPSMIEGLLLVRRVLTPEIVKIAVNKAGDHEISSLALLVENKKYSVEERDMEIHKLIARISGVHVYIFILNFFNNFIKENSFLFFNSSVSKTISEKFHRDLLKAFQSKDASSASHLASKVLMKVEEVVLKNMSHHKDGVK
jgi:GntR family transcriptional repressor for pyruvate dehydrogenase complex